MTGPHTSDHGPAAVTGELRRRRAAGRDPGAVLVPDASGGDPIPWEEVPDGGSSTASQPGEAG